MSDRAVYLLAFNFTAILAVLIRILLNRYVHKTKLTAGDVIAMYLGVAVGYILGDIFLKV